MIWMGSLSCIVRVKMFFLFIIRNKDFINLTFLAIKILRLMIRFLIMLKDTITLLFIELYHLVNPLFKKFLVFITFKEKLCFVLKRYVSDILINKILVIILIFYYKKISVQNCMINRFEYGVQICSTHANFFLHKKISP